MLKIVGVNECLIFTVATHGAFAVTDFTASASTARSLSGVNLGQRRTCLIRVGILPLRRLESFACLGQWYQLFQPSYKMYIHVEHTFIIKCPSERRLRKKFSNSFQDRIVPTRASRSIRFYLKTPTFWTCNST